MTSGNGSVFNISQQQNSCTSGVIPTDKVPLSPVEKVAAYSIVYGLLFIVSLGGNSLVCIIIVKNKDMRTVTNMFLLNMAASDIFSTVFAIPSLLARQVSPHYWPLGGFMCHSAPVISTISVSVSIYTMVALAIDRYQAVVNPFHARAVHTVKRTMILILLTWILSAAVAAPQTVVVTLKFQRPYKFCTEDWAGKGGITANQIYTVIAFILLFVIPTLVISVTYVIIIQRLWQPEAIFGGPNVRSEPQRCDTACDTEQWPENSAVERAKKKRKTTYMLLTVVVVFLICMLPFQILILVAPFRDVNPSSGYILWGEMSYVLAVCSMACNPFIYSFFSEKFRKGFMDVFKCRSGDDSAQEGNTSSVILQSSANIRK